MGDKNTTYQICIIEYLNHIYVVFVINIRIILCLLILSFILYVFLDFDFSWVNPLLYRGFKKELDQDDLYETLVEDKSDILGQTLER